jgi:hypothetical protein
MRCLLLDVEVLRAFRRNRLTVRLLVETKIDDGNSLFSRKNDGFPSNSTLSRAGQGVGNRK